MWWGRCCLLEGAGWAGAALPLHTAHGPTALAPCVKFSKQGATCGHMVSTGCAVHAQVSNARIFSAKACTDCVVKESTESVLSLMSHQSCMSRRSRTAVHHMRADSALANAASTTDCAAEEHRRPQSCSLSALPARAVPGHRSAQLLPTQTAALITHLL